MRQIVTLGTLVGESQGYSRALIHTTSRSLAPVGQESRWPTIGQNNTILRNIWPAVLEAYWPIVSYWASHGQIEM